MVWHKRLPVAAALAVILTVSVSSQDKPGDAFYTAIRANDLTRLNAMLAAGANINEKDERGITPLMYSGWVGSAEAMKLLLDHGADPNLVNSSGSTALMLSAAEIAKVRLLLDHGANVNVVSARGRTALLLAAMNSRSAEIVKLLMAAGADVKAVDQMKVTALHAAALGNDTETVRLLLDAGLDPNVTDLPSAYTPLLHASSNNNLAAVRLLLARGADVNGATNDGSVLKVKAGTLAQGNFTPLMMAAPFGSLELIKTLLDAGAKVNAQDVRGMTALMLAVANDRQGLDVVSALIGKGADVNIKSKADERALDWALKIGSFPVIHALRRAGGLSTPSIPPVLPAFAPADLKSAAQRSVMLMERTGAGTAATGGCASCHSHNITDLVTNLARAKGLQVDEKAANGRRRRTRVPYLSPLTMLERFDVPGTPDVPLYTLGALANEGYKADRVTDGILALVLGRQSGDGSWIVPHGAIPRPPIEDGDITRTAIAVGVLKNYGAPGRAAEFNERIARARDWLLAAKATTSDDRNMQLVGLQSAGVDKSVLRRLANAILSTQRPDGGWGQRAELKSDAYATGQTLYALATSEVVTRREAAYQKGVKYLLSTQHADGSWYVSSRSPKFQPFFESGFPYGHDQWISTMATGWAAAALALAIEDPQKTAMAGK